MSLIAQPAACVPIQPSFSHQQHQIPQQHKGRDGGAAQPCGWRAFDAVALQPRLDGTGIAIGQLLLAR
ncbi:MAG: hypothetical protein ACO28M_02945, partial [Vulcanococcus sp.]